MSFPIKLTTMAAAVALATSAAPAQAAEEKIDLESWSQETDFSNVWRAEQLYGMQVNGTDGEQIGDVRNIIVGPDNKITHLIVESGGFLDIGDTHLKVAWDEISMSDDNSSLTVPMTDDNLPAFSMFGDYPETGSRSWRVTELKDDYVTLSDGQGYGMVDDVVFGGEGELLAVLVRPDLASQPGYYTPGLFAYPFHGYDYGYEPGAAEYNLPYSKDEIDVLEPIDVS